MALTLTPNDIWAIMGNRTGGSSDSYEDALAAGNDAATWLSVTWPVVTAMIAVYEAQASNVPTAIMDQCARRLAMYLWAWDNDYIFLSDVDRDNVNSASKAWVRSGAASMLAPWVQKRILST